MRSTRFGFLVGAAILATAASIDAQTYATAGAGTSPAVADTVLPASNPLSALQPGVPVRARWATCGDWERPVKEEMGTFLELDRESFEIEVWNDDRPELHQVAFDDLLRLEVGTERRQTGRGTWIGAATGAAVGLLFDPAGAAVLGLIGAGTGAWIGSQSRAVEWREIPISGPAYCQ